MGIETYVVDFKDRKVVLELDETRYTETIYDGKSPGVKIYSGPGNRDLFKKAKDKYNLLYDMETYGAPRNDIVANLGGK